jgi:hypothetical protein
MIESSGNAKEGINFYFKNLIVPVITREGGFKTMDFGKREHGTVSFFEGGYSLLCFLASP